MIVVNPPVSPKNDNNNSNDKKFIHKFIDVNGLHMRNPHYEDFSIDNWKSSPTAKFLPFQLKPYEPPSIINKLIEFEPSHDLQVAQPSLKRAITEDYIVDSTMTVVTNPVTNECKEMEPFSETQIESDFKRCKKENYIVDATMIVATLPEYKPDCYVIPDFENLFERIFYVPHYFQSELESDLLNTDSCVQVTFDPIRVQEANLSDYPLVLTYYPMFPAVDCLSTVPPFEPPIPTWHTLDSVLIKVIYRKYAFIIDISMSDPIELYTYTITKILLCINKLITNVNSETKDEVKVESNGIIYDNKGVYSKKQKFKTVSRPKFIIKDDDFIFPQNEDNDFIGVTDFFRTLKNSDVPRLLGIVANTKMSKDLKREFNPIKISWRSDQRHYDKMREFLLIHAFTGATLSEPTIVQAHPPNVLFVSDNRLFIDAISLTHFEPRIDGNSKKSPLFTRTNHQINEFIYDIFGQPSSSRLLPPRKLKGILRSLCERNSRFEPIQDFLSKACYYVKNFKQVDKSHLSWIHTYIPAEWYFISFDEDDAKEAHDVFVKLILSLREKFFNYAKHYFTMSKMQPWERTAFFQDQSKVFSDKLKSAEAQALFEQGLTKQEVCDSVFKRHINSIQREASHGAAMVNHRKKAKKSKFTAVRNSRLAKNYYNDIYQLAVPNDEIEKSMIPVEEFITPTPKVIVESKNEMEVIPISEDLASKVKRALNAVKAERPQVKVENQKYEYDEDGFVILPIKQNVVRPKGIINKQVREDEIRLVSCKDQVVTESLNNTTLISTSLVSLALTFQAYLAYRFYMQSKKLIKNTIEDVTIKANDVVDSAHIKFSKTVQPVTNTFSFLSNISSPESKVMYIELKTVIHILYHAYNQDYMAAAEWASNFMVTRGIQLIDLLVSPDFYNFKKTVDQDPIITYQGKKYTVDKDKFDILIDTYGTGEYERCLDLYASPEVSTEAYTPESYTKWSQLLFNLLIRAKLIDMDDSDIRANNNMFTFINNHRKEMELEASNFRFIVSSVTRLLFSYDPFDDGYNDFVKEIADTIFKTSAFITKGEKIANSRAELLEAVALYQKSLLLPNNPRMETLTPTVKTRALRCFAQLEVLAARCKQYLNGTLARDTPLSIIFTGPPGVGKTAATNYLKAAICFLEGTEYSEEKQYTINSKSEYWEGYHQQKFVYMDDMLKSLDIEQRRQEAMNIIDMINTSAYNLNMAFGDKGTNFFDSEYVIMTTNAANKGINNTQWNLGITDTGAFLRRLGLVLHREEPFNYDMDLLTIEFKIDQCIPAPALVGTKITVKNLPKLVLLLRKKMQERSNKIKYSPKFLKEVYGPTIAGVIDSVVSLDKSLNHDTITNETKELDNVESTNQQFDLTSRDEYELNQAIIESEQMVKVESLTDNISTTLGKFYDLLFPRYHNDIDGEDLRYLPKALGDPIPNHPELVPEIETPTETTANKYEYLVKLYKECGKNRTAEILCLSLGVIASIVASYGLYTLITSHTNSQSKKWYDPDQSRRGNKGVKSHFKNVAARKGAGHFVAQSSGNNYLESLVNTIGKGVFQIRAKSTASSQTATGFHIKDRVVVVPAHFYIPVNEGIVEQCEIQFGDKVYDLPWPDVDDVVKMDKEDLIAFVLPNTIQIPKALYPYFCTEDQYIPKDVGANLELLSCGDNGYPVIKPATRGIANKNVSYEEHGHDFLIETPIVYYATTRGGDSGALVATCGPQGSPKLLAMHVGRLTRDKNNVGLAIPMSQAYCDVLLNCLSKPGVVVESLEEPIPMKVLRRVPMSEAHYPPNKSKIRPSSLNGCFGPAIKRPAILKSYPGQVNVLNKAIGKMHQEQTPVYPFDKERLLAYLQHTYPRAELNGVLPGVISYKEALSGCPVKHSPSICYNTSAGYGFNKGKKGKASYLIRDGNNFDYEPCFLKQLMEIESQLLNGEQYEFLWADSLKDECRLHEKVDQFKTRLFSACQITYLILSRKYFMDMNTYLMYNCTMKPVSVGIDLHSLQATELYYRLNQTSDSVIAGDFSNFDGKLPKYIGEVVLEFINWWYNDGPVNAQVRQLLFEHIYSAKHIIYDCVYQVVDGNPSGNPMTTMYNSLCNISMCFIILHEDLHIPEGNFNLAVYGDDNIITVAGAKLKVSDFAPYFKARFDLEYTHFSKTECDVYDTLETVAFLGRRFVLEDGIVRAPLELVTILQSVYWISADLPEESILMDTARSFFLELSHYERCVFEEYSLKLLRIVKERLPRLYPAVKHIFESKSYFAYQDRYYRSEGTFFTPQSRDFKSYGVNNPDNEIKPTDASEFNDRHINIPDSTQSVELGNYLDASEVTPAAVDSYLIQPIYKECNMETFDLDSVLNREYLLGTYSWTGSQAANTLLANINLPQDLLTQTFIKEKVKNFTYARFAFRLSFRCVASKFDYGKFVVLYKPCPFLDPYLTQERSTLQNHCNDMHILVSASASEVAIFDVPFIFPKRAFHLIEDIANVVGNIQIKVYNPLHSCTDVIPTAKIFVTAQFLETEMFLPSAFVAESRKEAVMKSKQGVISKALETTDSVLAKIQNVPFIDSYVKGFRTVTRPAAKLAKVLGLDKPTTLATTNVMKIDFASDMKGGKGIDLSRSLGMDPENSISAQRVTGGISYDEMSLTALAGTPSLFDQLVMNEGDGIHLYAFNMSNTSGRIGYLDYVANQFRSWSGSIKLKFYFTASVMQTASFVIYLADNFEDDWMQCYHKIVNVNGDTEFEVTVPYPRSEYVLQSDVNVPCSVGIRVLAWSQPDPSLDNPIYVNVYRSLASDGRFYGHIERQYVITESNPRADFAKSFDPIHNSVTGYVPENVVYGDVHTHLNEMLHKYIPYRVTNPLSIEYAYNVQQLADNLVAGIELICLPYQFWAGSIRHKYVSGGTARTCLNMMFHTSNQSNYIGTSFSSITNPVVEAELPYYRPELFVGTRNKEVVNYPCIQTAGAPAYQFKSTGEDFVTHFLGAFPAGIFGPVNTTYGYTGLRTFLSP